MLGRPVVFISGCAPGTRPGARRGGVTWRAAPGGPCGPPVAYLA